MLPGLQSFCCKFRKSSEGPSRWWTFHLKTSAAHIALDGGLRKSTGSSYINRSEKKEQYKIIGLEHLVHIIEVHQRVRDDGSAMVEDLRELAGRRKLLKTEAPLE
ncbi:hypothetical protein DPMN_093679 [Dreissena polymorpha]|uniref:Uncharacterized protein n=1 Tax=Dreissena polymorpha TaxID=45954 RepID=A0A9D4L4I2_DREPO|nr:hypothetical protein DPMN_093679 [Dreissena polymorpha]